eukprot:gene28795-35718_t
MSTNTNKHTGTSTNADITLRTEGLSKRWGAFAANSDVSLTFAPGARHAGGKVYLGGEDITQLPQHQRVQRGMTRTFQLNTLFAGMTVLESVALAVCERRGLQSVWYKTVEQHADVIDEAMALLTTLKLADQANSVTRSMAYGKQRLVEIALALATQPRILLLDEPAAGIPQAESKELFEVLAQLPRDVTVLFIEHDMGLVFRFADRITVMVGGKVLTEGTPAEIAADPRVKEVYLGEAEHG